MATTQLVVTEKFKYFGHTGSGWNHSRGSGAANTNPSRRQLSRWRRDRHQRSEAERARRQRPVAGNTWSHLGNI